MQIDPNAPLAARKEILIAAPLEKVWWLLTGFTGWPDWQPEISSVKMEGKPEVGSVFRWKAKGMNIISTIRVYEPPGRIGWTGNSLGMQAVHLWSFEPRDGGTLVATEESLSGWFPRLIRLFDPRFLEKSLAASLQVLKAQAER